MVAPLATQGATHWMPLGDALGALALTQGGGPGVTALLEKHGLPLALAGQGVFLVAIGVWLLVRRRKKAVPLRPE